MTLTVDNATPYLVSRGLVSVASIVDGDYTVIDSARRNRNLKVVCEGAPSYLVKQPDRNEPGSEQTIRLEAGFYELCQTWERARGMQAVVPRLFAFYPDDGVLVIELLRDAVPLWQHYTASDAEHFPIEAAAALGRALGVFHATFRGCSPADHRLLSGLGAHAPWILWVHKPGPDILERISSANLETLKILQKEPRLSLRLDELRKAWCVVSLVHNDVKGENVLVRAGGGAAPGPDVRIVDWELLQFGDPAWDVGAVFHDFLLFWIASMPLSATRTPEEMLQEAQYPLTAMQPAIRACWREYRRSFPLGADEGAGFLSRAVRYAAARLIQSAYERAQGAAVLPNQSVVSLQLAANILADPDAALLHLLGIPPVPAIAS
jgi:Ser/Thr protein kinase RdoA (MazF antagonist)